MTARKMRHATLKAKTARSDPWNGPFCILKRAVLHSKTTHTDYA